jgi:integrase
MTHMTRANVNSSIFVSIKGSARWKPDGSYLRVKQRSSDATPCPCQHADRGQGTDHHVAARLGHADPAITLRIYAHQFDRDDRAAAEAIDRALGQ